MTRFFPITSIPVIIFFALSVFSAHLHGAPAVSLSLVDESIIVKRPFSIELAVSWEGDPERYVVENPRLKPPQGIDEVASSHSTSAREESHLLHYRYTLCAATTGTYVLDPIEISYWEKNASGAQTAHTGALTFKVGSRTEAVLTRYRVPGALLLIFIGFFITLFVLSTKKKKAHSAPQPPGVSAEESIARERKQCTVYKISGDWENYLKGVIAIHRKLPSAETNEKSIADLRQLAERVHYGSYRPSAEEISLIERQLEKACSSAFPGERTATKD